MFQIWGKTARMCFEGHGKNGPPPFGVFSPDFHHLTLSHDLRVRGALASPSFNVAFDPGTDTTPGTATVRCGALVALPVPIGLSLDHGEQ